MIIVSNMNSVPNMLVDTSAHLCMDYPHLVKSKSLPGRMQQESEWDFLYLIGHSELMCRFVTNRGVTGIN